MKKIPTLFKRDPEDMAHILQEVNPDCQWVIDGEGRPTVKLDGMCCAIIDGKLYKRREIKALSAIEGMLEGFMLVDHDVVTDKAVGWIPVGEGSDDKYFREAFDNLTKHGKPDDGTYELVGPKSQGGIEGYLSHELMRHGHIFLPSTEVPTGFDELGAWLAGQPIEGVVWHHPDGRMAKIKGRDFGFKRQPA